MLKLLQVDSSVNSVVWTKDSITHKPLLCIAGEKPKQIRILDIESGEAVRSIPGHGKGINDLAISPLSTDLLASCSEDYTIRLWNLHPKYQDQPCVAMFCGEGHRQPILALRLHPNGRWMLSGGLDTAVCLWAVPSLEELERSNDDSNERKEPKIIYYPHFHSTEVHHNYVDCVQFYGDLIISKASRVQNDKQSNEILLWKIDGFDPNDPPPSAPPIPSPDVHTRSSFPHSSRSTGFQRLLTFQMPHSDRFYFRFGLLHTPAMRPILCMGNQESKYFFWDLQKLEEGWDIGEEKPKKRRRKPKSGVSSENLSRLDDLRGGVKVESFASSDGAGGATREWAMSSSIPSAMLMCVSAMPSSTSNSGAPERKYALSDPFLPLKPHHTITPKTNLSSRQHFATSQMAWSPDGTWLVGVGDFGMMCIFHRDASVVNGVPKAVESFALKD